MIRASSKTLANAAACAIAVAAFGIALTGCTAAIVDGSTTAAAGSSVSFAAHIPHLAEPEPEPVEETTEPDPVEETLRPEPDPTPSQTQDEITDQEHLESLSSIALSLYAIQLNTDFQALEAESPDPNGAMAVSSEGHNALVFTFQFYEQVPETIFDHGAEEQEAQLKADAQDIAIPELEAAGVMDPQVTYIYLNADGSDIWTTTFTADS
ncbi:hypothetical protein [Demequina sediminicola]|uniref:hypothetical protein n=1 Tax=Demequina sediminicola TaxID=1095026 RepID=UPI0007804368|nr:hypothetical protein [Demequina sediminicola]